MADSTPKSPLHHETNAALERCADAFLGFPRPQQEMEAEQPELPDAGQLQCPHTGPRKIAVAAQALPTRRVMRRTPPAVLMPNRRILSAVRPLEIVRVWLAAGLGLKLVRRHGVHTQEG